jgi:CRISPR-associated protein Csb2
VRIAVPNNDLDVVASLWAKGQEPKKQPAELKTMKTVRPNRLAAGDTVSYFWPLPDPVTEEVRGHAEVLSAAARSMVALGWGVDLVAGNGRLLSPEEADRVAGECWQPTPDTAARGLRVPIAGTLEALIGKHQAFLTRIRPDGFQPGPPLTAFRVVGYRRSTEAPTRCWAAFRLHHPSEDRTAAFPMIGANSVAAMTRHMTAQLAPREWVDHYVHGHYKDHDKPLPRFSYLPLPSLERRGDRGIVLGSIRRVVVAELVDAAESRLQWVRQMLPSQILTDDKTQAPKAMLVPLSTGDWVLRQYTQPSDTWASVTPLVLPGSDEGRFAKAEKLFFKVLRHAGYSPDALATPPEFRNVCFWPGGDLALGFQRPDYLKKGHWSVYHVRLRWRQPMLGPLALGAGRHCGLGVFAAMRA